MSRDEVVNWIISVGAAIVLAIAVTLFIFFIVAFPWWFCVLITAAYLIFMFAMFIHTAFFEE